MSCKLKYKEIKLTDYGEMFGPRVLGIKIKEEILEQIESSPGLVIVFNLEGVSSISTGFSKELFGGLWSHFKGDFKDRVKFRIPENRNILLSSITKGIRTVRN